MQYAVAMAPTKPKPTSPSNWRFARKIRMDQRRSEAASEAEAIAKGVEEFGQDAKRLMAVRR